MILPGYQIQTKLEESNSSVIYRGISEVENKPVVIKFLNKEYPTPEEIARFKREYELTQSLVLDGTIKVYCLEKYKNTLFMVLEDFGGDSLKNYLSDQKLSLEKFLNLAIQMTDILGQIHSRNVMHKDINPSNIVWNSKTNQVKIIDFGISTELSYETPALLSPDVLEGTLPYMSPEQTGRMNRAIDYRTDLYSLGITFYQMLTNQLPFASKDPLELVHYHIAKKPLPPHEIDRQIPEILSQILLKLLEKTAEERYQTAYGLKWDLELCLERIEKTTDKLETFAIGERDISNIFQIPQKLYGREEEIETLLNEFENVAKGNSVLLLVAGYSGVGKSVLVHEVHKSIAQKKGYFTQGKFEQFQRNVPYSALIRAFQSLVLQILSEPQENLSYWKERLLQTLGNNGQIILDLIPEVEYLMGKQPTVPELNPTDTKNRFLTTFRNFLETFVVSGHPLVIFLDDLQWADIPTLNLIQNLVTTTKIPYLFLIGAYRDNEVTEGHPLNLVLDTIEKVKPIRRLFLKPLQEDTVNQIIFDSLHRDPKDTKPLAKLVYQKTEGNPFFINALLKRFHQEGHISFHLISGSWNWNLEAIQGSKVSENVVEFMLQELQKLPLETQEVLGFASCIGDRFDLLTLSMLYEQTATETAKALMEAIRKQIIIPLDDRYRIVDAENSDFEVKYQFSHDRIQQAAYSLIEGSRVKEIHLSIGRFMLKQIMSGEEEEKFTEMVGHLNEGRSLITDPKELEELIQMNLSAAQKAKASTAFRSALQYLVIGEELLPKNSWIDQYELTFNLFQEYASCAYLCGENELAEISSKTLLKNSRTRLEQAQIHSMQLRQYSYSRKMKEAIRVGILGLKLLGIRVSEKPSMLPVLLELLKVKKNLRGLKIEDLLNRPVITDPEVKLAMKILIDYIPPSFLTGNSNLFALVVLKQTNFSLQYGNGPESASVFASYAVLLAGLGDLQSSNEFGKLALKLNEQFNDVESKCRTLALYTIFCQSWNHHWKTLQFWYNQAIEAGLQSGDMLFMAHSCYHILLWDPEIRLDINLEKSKKYISLIESTPYLDALDLVMVHQNYRLSLYEGLSEKRITDEKLRFERMKKTQFFTGLASHLLYQLQIYFAYENYDLALHHIREGEKVIHSLAGALFVVEFTLYSFLTISALFPKMSLSDKVSAKIRLKKKIGQMKKWANHCPLNFLHLEFLMEAELARISGKTRDAIKLYDQAIHTARTNEYPRYETLANELAGKFYLSLGQERIAKIYMTEAHYGYTRWGALGKVRHLEETYPQLIYIGDSARKTPKDMFTTSFSIETSSGPKNSLDLSSILKSSQAISGEIVLDKLLDKLMHITIENAGATLGYFLSEREGQIYIEAEGKLEEQPIKKTENAKFVPTTLIHYIIRLREPVVLNNATHEGLFTKDEYITKNKP
ncbi:MAG: serine/threonine-protein kinase PknK, partial [Leptospiraceae bacterium]|nr:serine/threonine-protein kinase PknK [Leptospiraceae bacterium]